jgi:hypothetical protein
MKRKGVCYDVGRDLYGDWRKDYSPEIVHHELDIIKDDLHCNAVRICSRDVGRLAVASEYALKQGLEVWFSPELWNKSPETTLDYTAKAAETAERLRRQFPDKMVMSVGSELTLFMKGIVEGSFLWQRIGNAFKGDFVKSGKHNKPLNDYLFRVAKAVRQVYDGRLTYASLPFEQVDWKPFDFIGVDHYRATRIKDKYADMLKPLLNQGKPVVIIEFGCCTYQGAEDAGGQAFNIVDIKSLVMHQLPLLGRLIRPRLNGNYVRDEELQAREIIDQLQILDDSGVDGAFVYTFVFPNNPYNENPRNDLDMASYSLVKSYEGGKHGVTYPNMTWEPKESFNAIANYYGKEFFG